MKELESIKNKNEALIAKNKVLIKNYKLFYFKKKFYYIVFFSWGLIVHNNFKFDLSFAILIYE